MTQMQVQFAMINGMAANVTDYGAIGDGANDDTAEIQAAITAAAGGAVFFPAGTYKISDSLTVSSNTVIVIDPSAAINVAASSFASDDAVFKIDKKDRVTIRGNGATITGQREGTGTNLLSWGVGVSGSTNIRIEDLNIVNCGGDGINIKGSDDGTVVNSENVWVERCRAHNNMRAGFMVVSGKNVWLRDCIGSTSNGKSPQSGFHVEPSASTSILWNVNFIGCIGTSSTSAQFQTVIGNTSTAIAADVDIVFDNCKAVDSTTSGMIGFDINSHKATMANDGRVVLNNCAANNIDSYGLALRNIDKAGQQVTVINFQSVDTNTGQRTTYGGNAPVTIYSTSSADWPNPGGVRINGLKIVDNTVDRTPYWIASAGTAHDDMQIRGFEWINSVGTTAYPYMDDDNTDTYIDWTPGPYNISRASNMTLTARHNGWLIDNKGSAGAVDVTLSPVSAGIVYYIEIDEAQAFRIYPDAADTITPNGVSDGKYMESSELGATAVIYANRDADNWIVERTGTWTDEP